nr:MAG TPA: hypothetical protein [Caudoviricetes sp.]
MEKNRSLRQAECLDYLLLNLIQTERKTEIRVN